MDSAAPREGDLFREIEIDDHRFRLCWGYYEEADRSRGEPVVLYPDLQTRPLYCRKGHRLVTAVQDPCKHYTLAGEEDPEYCCSDCIYYADPAEEIARCLFEGQRKTKDNR